MERDYAFNEEFQVLVEAFKGLVKRKNRIKQAREWETDDL